MQADLRERHRIAAPDHDFLQALQQCGKATVPPLPAAPCRHPRLRKIFPRAHFPPMPTPRTRPTDDLRIRAVRPLLTPALLQEWLPTPEPAQALVESSRAEIARVLHGQDDDRLLVVVGPCSIHDHERRSTTRAVSGTGRCAAA